MARPEVAGLGWPGPGHWHVALGFLGRVDEVDEAAAAMQTVVAVPTIARMGPQTGRLGDRVLHVPVEGLSALAAAVVAATAQMGEPPGDRPFHGHITLARPRGRSRVDLRRLAGTALAAEWPVSEITLVASTTLAGGAHYDVLARRQLSPGDLP